jgi:4-amino-4-deoxy-L-arabinose transferase-like glycosyltransferase
MSPVPPEETRESPPRTSRTTLLVCALLFFAATAAVMFSYRGFGFSWDEAYYYEPSRDAGEWLGDMVLSRWKPYRRSDVDIFWREVSELPSVTKFANGISLALFSDLLGPLRALRLPAALAFGATLGLIYLFIQRFYGQTAGIAASLAYALMPRVFGHAHIGATESITAFLCVLTVFLFLRGIGSWKASLALGVVFGLALDTKINCVFLPLVLIFWAQLYHRRDYANNVFAMLFFSPLVMVLAWPWLWYDTVSRLLSYVEFHATHQFTAVYYFGEKYNYGAPLAPWHYPFVMTLLTVPPITLVLALAGGVWAMVRIRRDDVAIFILISALFPIVVSSLPQSPKYDGERLFLPAFAFIAMLAGLGVCAVIAGYKAKEEKTRRGAAVAVALLVLVFANGVLGIARSHPYELSYFNVLIGGMKGAYDAGLETTYWGEAVNEDVLAYLNAQLPRGATVKTLALHTRIFDYLRQWGMLRKDLVFNPPPPYDYHVMLVRKGFFGRAEWYFFRHVMPEKVFSHQGVPLVVVYKTPPEMRVVRP